MKSAFLAFLALLVLLIGCGGGKSKDSHNHETPMDLPAHNADQCPSLSGKYKGKSQNQEVIYEFVKVGNAFIVNVTVPQLSPTPVAITINGKAHVTGLGKAAYGCEEGKINAVSLLNDRLNKAQLIPNVNGLELKEELPKATTSQFYKMVN